MHQPADHKRKLLEQYIIPLLRPYLATTDELINKLVEIVRVQNTVKLQELEGPGAAEEGRMFFSIHTLLHSFTYNHTNRSQHGTRIWLKRQFAFSGPALLHGRPRTDYIQSLEGREVLSISYPHLLNLIKSDKGIERAFSLVVVENEQYLREQHDLLSKPPLIRVAEFRRKHPTFVACSSQQIQAMHVGLSLRGYINQLQKLRG
ncbi:hypothetical protein [Pedobacter deserti]|uniref:hypothetical protein n=1 Tax=Pedobacter deserti TaxID=2817382 RepID=UPI00210B0F56|nr:hypothetical protein [Pedobacter sp. SYSU D00382]